ncbi:unnamed protein product, partial [Effrenium voratum]
RPAGAGGRLGIGLGPRLRRTAGERCAVPRGPAPLDIAAFGKAGAAGYVAAAAHGEE